MNLKFWKKTKDPFTMTRKEEKELKEAMRILMETAEKYGWSIEHLTDEGEDASQSAN